MSSNPGSALPLGVNIGPFTDAMFVGIMLSVFLWGITVVQTFNYFASNSGNDGWMLKTFVGILFALDTVSSVLTVDMAHIYLIENFGNLVILTTLPLSAIMEVLFNVIIVFLVELFFARRVFLLNQRRILMPALISIVGLAGLVSGIFIVVDISKTRTVAALAKPSMKIETALCNAFEAVSDLLASAAMSYEFYKNKGAIKSTNSLLDKLLGFAVARGGLVTVAQFLTLALYVAQPTKLNWMPVHFMLGKLCHITMITILNSRESLRRGPKGSLVQDSMVTDTVINRQMGTASQFQLRALDNKNGGMSGIHIHHEQISEYDDDPRAIKHHV
ncbi:hypothetical protein DFH08DRAFT_208955 [Mycena albidolilacea]|uniref:DUF6534 domain-containing protein n=1 Tax=Mycena albidolilacea TaxID=1033008 RepID=A0AAD7A1Q2_9AGAR|nr:hypothetical protein DFH08DRAFT_208955 [Mycena albidolilacea]